MGAGCRGGSKMPVFDAGLQATDREPSEPSSGAARKDPGLPELGPRLVEKLPRDSL